MTTNVKGKIEWIGVNDRRKHLFENIWPLPNGVNCNCYLINDDKTALLDTIEMGIDSMFLATIEGILGDKPLDYLIINHMEFDHAGEIANVVKRYPKVQIIGNVKTFKILKGYFNITDNLMEVKDGEELSLGYHKLKFIYTPWVHWPETMVTFDLTDGVLFSADAFGTFGTLDGAIFDDEMDVSKYEDEMRRYYSNIVGKYSNMVQKAFAKLPINDIKVICPLHGPVWRSNPKTVINLYNKWSKYEGEDGVVIIYASMYGNTEYIADYIARKLCENGVRDIKIYDVSKTHISYIISDIWKYKGVILGSCSYNAQMFPLMESLTRDMEHMNVKNKELAIFGSYSWNGGGVRNLQTFADNIDWNLVSPAVEIFGSSTLDKLKECDNLAIAMAQAINKIK